MFDSERMGIKILKCLFIVVLIVACDPYTFQLQPDFTHLDVPQEGYNVRISKQGITVDLKGNQTRYYGSTSGRFSMKIINGRSNSMTLDQSNFSIKVDGRLVPEASFRLRPVKDYWSKNDFTSLPIFAFSSPIERITINPNQSNVVLIEYSFSFNTPGASMSFVFDLEENVNIQGKISFETRFVF
ncbi:hypothetical protein [Candidatus Nitronereus thalassa]|uniref:Uncharacterized protein n=1 Tax=Candidatus Nitronereus thalassa TaxID=3020898 RepID=A0ABU3KBI8_9BACT|nr:hypothetical protein [Candidatus Nitronereus thalassa]MDT7043806.1 hypothetical protein [Candidatus Nitronereus thalassa]